MDRLELEVWGKSSKWFSVIQNYSIVARNFGGSRILGPVRGWRWTRPSDELMRDNCDCISAICVYWCCCSRIYLLLLPSTSNAMCECILLIIIIAVARTCMSTRNKLFRRCVRTCACPHMRCSSMDVAWKLFILCVRTCSVHRSRRPHLHCDRFIWWKVEIKTSSHSWWQCVVVVVAATIHSHSSMECYVRIDNNWVSRTCKWYQRVRWMVVARTHCRLVHQRIVSFVM